MTSDEQGACTFPVGAGIGATQAVCAVMSSFRAAGRDVTRTVNEPISIMPGPAGTQPGKTFRLTGQGMPSFRAEGTGDLYVKAKVVMPADLTPEARTAADRFLELTHQPDPRARET